MKEYTSTWEDRCYSSGIPDEAPTSLMKSMRVPTYKAIAIAVLKNDMRFYGLGFKQRDSHILDAVIDANRNTETSNQYELF